MSDHPQPSRLMSEREVIAELGLSRSTLIRMEREGDFPRRVPIGRRRVAFLRAEIDSWLEEKAANREPRRVAQ